MTRAARNVTAALATLLCLAACASAPPPTHVDSPQEWGAAYAECLSDEGWDVTVAEDGSVSVTVPAAQGDAYDAATAQCREGLTITQFDEYTDAQRHDLYDDQVAVHDCLVDLGVTLPTPPSFTVFDEQGGVWTPWLDVAQDVVSGDGPALQEQCPQGR